MLPVCTSDCPGALQWSPGPELAGDNPGHHPWSHEEHASMLSNMHTSMQRPYKVLSTILNCSIKFLYNALTCCSIFRSAHLGVIDYRLHDILIFTLLYSLFSCMETMRSVRTAHPDAQRRQRATDWLDRGEATAPDHLSDYSSKFPVGLTVTDSPTHGCQTVPQEPPVYLFIYSSPHVPLTPLYLRFHRARPLISIKSPLCNCVSRCPKVCRKLSPNDRNSTIIEK